MRGKKEEVETECSARELVHTEVAVSTQPPSPSHHFSRPYQLTHPSLHAAPYGMQQYEQQQRQQETASAVSFVRKLGAEAGILGKYYCKEI